MTWHCQVTAANDMSEGVTSGDMPNFKGRLEQSIRDGVFQAMKMFDGDCMVNN